MGQSERGRVIPPYSAVVLAGGRGTRIAELYPDLPKPLVPTCGQPFLHWVSAWLAKQGFCDLVYSTGYRAEQIERWASQVPFGTAVRQRCRKEKEPLGTGGGVIHCMDLCSENFLVLNGDSMVLTDVAPMIEMVESGRCEAAMIGLHVADAARYGTLLTDRDGRLLAMREKQPGPGVINAGVYFLSRTLLALFPEGEPVSMEIDIIPGLLRGGVKVGVQVAVAPFLDIGTPQSVILAEEFIRNNSHFVAFP